MTRRRKVTQEAVDDVAVVWHVAGLSYNDVTVTLRDGSKHRGMVRMGGNGVPSFIPDKLSEFLEAVERIGGNETVKASNGESIESYASSHV